MSLKVRSLPRSPTCQSLNQCIANYSGRLRKKKPTLPILPLTDAGVFVPHGMLSRRIATGFPEELMLEITEMLAGSIHIRELHIPADVADLFQ